MATKKSFIAIACYCLLLHTIVVNGSDPEESCQKQGISCIQCSTDPGDPGWSKCGDPFDPKLHKELKRPATNGAAARSDSYGNMSTVSCDGLCVKWVKTSDKGGQSSIVRTCSTSLDLRFTQTASVCIYESRSGQGFMCFCRDNMCNRHDRLTARLTVCTLGLLVVLIFALFSEL